MTNAKVSLPHAKKIYIVEDHPAFREGLVQIVSSEEDLVVCGEAGDATQALTEIRRLKPDLVLVDITLPGKSGLDLIRSIRSNDRVTKLLVVSMHDEAIYANRVLRAGGDGYIMKQEDPSELIGAIRDVLDGRIYVSEDVMATMSTSSRKAANPIDQLTDSELEILDLLGRGKSNEEIAECLGLQVAFVESSCASLKSKLKLKNDNALIHHAVCWVQSEATPPNGAS